MYAQTTDAQRQTFNYLTPMLPGEEDFFYGWRHQPQLHTAPAFALNVEPVYPLSRDPILDPPSIPFPSTNTPPKEVVQLKKAPGRPRKYPKKDPNAAKKSGGRPKGSKDSYSRLAKDEKVVIDRKDTRRRWNGARRRRQRRDRFRAPGQPPSQHRRL
jgi:hypothetical protein